MAKIAIFDGNPLIWRASVMFAGLRLRSGRSSGCLYGATRNLMQAWGEVAADHLVVVWDWGHSRWRRALYPGYKSSRATKRKDEKAALGYDEVMSQLFACQQFLEYAGVQQIVVELVEADDLIGVLSSGLAQAGHQVVVVGSDHDLHQLLRPNVVVYDPIRKEWLDETSVPARYEGLRVDQLIDYLLLSGEAGDDIPKLPGVGPKRALEIMRAYGSVVDLVGRPADPQWQKTAWGRGLEEGRAGLPMSRRLVRIPTVEFLEELSDEERGRIAQACLRRPVQDRMAFSGFCDLWELRQVQQQVPVLFSLKQAPLEVLLPWLQPLIW